MRLFLLATLLLVTILRPSSVFAWAGGPWGGDVTTDDSGAGTYSAVMTGENLTGVAAFGSSPEVGGGGFYVVFHEGESYFGNMGAIVDTASRLVAGASSSGGAAFGFQADIYTTIPQIRFEGEGLLDSLATPSTISSTTETVVSSSTTVTQNGTTTVTTTVTDSSIAEFNVSVPFTIRGVRSSTATGSGFSTNLGGGGGGETSIE